MILYCTVQYYWIIQCSYDISYLCCPPLYRANLLVKKGKLKNKPNKPKSFQNGKHRATKKGITLNGKQNGKHGATKIWNHTSTQTAAATMTAATTTINLQYACFTVLHKQ